MRRGWATAVALLLLAGCASMPRPRGPAGPPVDESGQVLTYTPRPGEGWSEVSEAYFGDASRTERIARANGSTADRPPRAGTAVRVPVEAGEMGTVRALADARAAYNLGVERMRVGGQDEAAREAFEEAVDRAPHFVDARYNLGLVLIRLGRADRARAHLERVVDARPDDKDALYALAAARFHAGDHRGCLPPLERALELDPAFLRARFTHALALQELGRADEARQQWRRYLRDDPDSPLAVQARAHLRRLGG